MKFLDYYHVLEEKRRYEVPSVLSQLEKYKDDPNIYVSFTEINKVGINPKTGYGTPMGIYSYPLKKTFSKYFESQKIPWASDKEYLQVFRSKNPDKVAKGSTYTKAKLDADIDALDTLFHTKIDRSFNFIDEDFRQTSIQIFWSVTKKLVRNNTVKWGRLLARFYQGIVDDLGDGFIHPNEPIQAVFFNSSFIEVVDTIRNQKGEFGMPDWDSSLKQQRINIVDLWNKYGKSFKEFIQPKMMSEFEGNTFYDYFKEIGLLDDVMPLRHFKELHPSTVSHIAREEMYHRWRDNMMGKINERKYFNQIIQSLIHAFDGEQI